MVIKLSKARRLVGLLKKRGAVVVREEQALPSSKQKGSCQGRKAKRCEGGGG